MCVCVCVCVCVSAIFHDYIKKETERNIENRIRPVDEVMLACFCFCCEIKRRKKKKKKKRRRERHNTLPNNVLILPLNDHDHHDN